MKKSLKNWSALALANIIQQGLSLICLIRIARSLSTAEYGSYVLIINTIAIAQIVSMMGLPQILISSFVEDVY
jgi:O-antigen/teichoic acid export membrane protein